MFDPCRSRLTAAVLGALSCTTHAADTALEETVVTASPIKQSESAAILAKRDALNVLDAISADSIGRFPDQNLADSLARVPGIAIERDQGQARYVNLRGAPFRYTAIAFDGIDVPGAENGRIPRFDSFPAVITRQLTVNKAITANMPGEAVAGFINIETHSPFDKEGLGLAFDFGFGEQDLGGGDVEKSNLRVSWSGEQLGLLGFFSRNNREQITDNREYEFELAPSGERLTNELDFRSYKIERSDEAYGGTLEYRGEGRVSRLYLTSVYSEFVDKEERNQLVFSFLAPQAGLQADNAPLSVNRLLEDGIYDNSTFTNTLGADFRLAGFDIKTAYNYTETEYLVDLPILYQAAGFAGVSANGPVPWLGSYDLRDETDPLLYLNGDPSDSVFLSTFGLGVYNPLDQTVDKYKLDLTRGVGLLGDNSTLALGLQLDQREARGGALTQGLGAFPVDQLNPNDFNTGQRWQANTANTIGGTYFDNPALNAAWRATGVYPESVVPANNVVNLDEDILAAYGMLTSEFSWGSVIFGLRVEQTEVDNTTDGRTVSSDFTNWLPNAHVNVDLAQDLRLRVSASTGVNRPTYNEWRASASVDPIDREINGGNPRLDAEESWGFDSSLEYYVENGGLVSAAVFYRQVDNVIYADASGVDAGLYAPEFAGETWQYVGFLNGRDGVFSGVELNAVYFADALLQGLGLSANVTLADSEFTRQNGDTASLPGTSDMIWNAALFYENDGFSARLNYSWRDEWISPLEDPSEFWGEMERLDAQINYTLPVQWLGAETTLYASFNNLTDETDVRYAGNGTLNQSESYGMHYLLGLRVNY